MSEYAANPADVQEQEQVADPVPDAELQDENVAVPEEANEADVVEQTRVVPEDDEDYRE